MGYLSLSIARWTAACKCKQHNPVQAQIQCSFFQRSNVKAPDGRLQMQTTQSDENLQELPSGRPNANANNTIHFKQTSEVRIFANDQLDTVPPHANACNTIQFKHIQCCFSPPPSPDPDYSRWFFWKDLIWQSSSSTNPLFIFERSNMKAPDVCMKNTTCRPRIRTSKGTCTKKTLIFKMNMVWLFKT